MSAVTTIAVAVTDVPTGPCRRWLRLFNFRREAESDASEGGQDKEKRGKEREGDFLGPEKEGKSPRMTFRNPGAARRGMELTLPSTRYKATIRLNPMVEQPPVAFAGRRSP